MKIEIAQYEVLTEVCPKQVDGILTNGQWFHFRLRNNHAWVGLYDSEQAHQNNETCFQYKWHTYYEDTCPNEMVEYCAEYAANRFEKERELWEAYQNV